MELASWVESFLRRRLFVDLSHLSLNGFMLTSQQLLIDSMHQDRAAFLVKQLGGVSIAIDGHAPAKEWAALDRALRFGGKPPKKGIAFPDMLDDQGQAATTPGEIAQIAQ
eukprot:714839-Pyramimonas_sp.AAC.1